MDIIQLQKVSGKFSSHCIILSHIVYFVLYGQSYNCNHAVQFYFSNEEFYCLYQV